MWEIALLKISSQGVSNLEETKGQYFLSKESYFFTLRKPGCSDAQQGPGPWCWACPPAAAAEGWRRGRGPPPGRGHHTPPRARGSPPRGLPLHGNGTPKRQWATAPNLGAAGWAGCSRGCLGQPGASTASTWFLSHSVFSLLQGTSWLLKHSVGDVLVKMQYFYVM